VVVEGHGPTEEEGDDPESDTADGLEGKCGVEEEGVVAAGGLDDAGGEADVGEEIDADDEGVDERHLAEVGGEQQAGEDEAADDAKAGAGAVLEDGPEGGAEGVRFERAQGSAGGFGGGLREWGW